MANPEVILNGILYRDKNGNTARGMLAAAAIKSADGNTVEQHVADASLHLQQITVDASISTALNLLKDGGNGSTLPSDYSTLKKAADEISGVKAALNTFLHGEDDGGDIDRLIELVKAIADNKGSINELVADKVNKDDIVDALTSENADKVLSAAQGKAIKDIIDALATSLNSAISNLNASLAAEIDAIDTRAWVGVVDAIPEEWPAGVHPNGLLLLTTEA